MANLSQPELLTLSDLSVSFQSMGRSLLAVNKVSFALRAKEIVGLVGESGCGKSLTARAILRLPPENASISGSIFFEGRDLLTLSEANLRALRGRELAMIFQEPMTALNPVLTVGEQASEVLTTHLKLSLAEAKEQVIAMFSQVGIPEAKSRYASFPHQLSGGMRQRVMIAMSLLCNPKVLLADEPTTALDATISLQILELIYQQSREREMAVLFISHDLDLVKSMADQVGVMYAGHLVEWAKTSELFVNPLHPYTRGLLASSPSRYQGTGPLPTIAGAVPSLLERPKGCPFAPRCSQSRGKCSWEVPSLLGDSEHQ
ncbi:MAG: ABC transporter ATP-binding protein, partial [Desulfovibrio sp.]|nr:ABC transporter ATP-binding protein [Desulfovibrio sp.]